MKRVQLPPSEKLVYGVTLALIFFFGLFALQIVHLIFLHKWNDQIWAAITGMVGLIIGAFFGGRA